MATSSIFANIEITDPEKVARFSKALEESIELSKKHKPTPSGVKIVRDKDEIRKLLQRGIR